MINENTLLFNQARKLFEWKFDFLWPVAWILFLKMKKTKNIQVFDVLPPPLIIPTDTNKNRHVEFSEFRKKSNKNQSC